MTEQNSYKKAKRDTAEQITTHLIKFEKIRFVLVGALNTAVDFIILLLLATSIGVPASIANIISTSIALLVSYVLNKKAVFGNTDTNNRTQFILFVLVTLFGLWVLQTIIITIVSSILSQWLGIAATNAAILIIAKLAATVVSLTWNYLWYSRVVFSQKKPTKQ